MSTHTKIVSVTAVTDSTPDYASGDLCGGKLTFTAALSQDTGTGMLISVNICDKSGQVGDVDLILFDSDPSSTTFTENGTFAVDPADVTKIMAVIGPRSATDFTFTTGVKSLGSLAWPLRAVSSTGAPARTFYGAMVAREAINLASASDLTVRLGIVLD